MSAPSVPELMRLWRKGERTAEQSAGYELQHLVEWLRWRADVERRLHQHERPEVKPI